MSTTPKDVNTITYIYGLYDKEDGKIRYIGKTVQKIDRRLLQHISDAKREKIKNHRVYWLRSVLNKGYNPSIIEIDQCTWIKSQELEMFYIKKYKEEGYDLVNETEGGEGNLGYKKKKHTIDRLKNSLRNRSKKIYQYDLYGHLIQIWRSVPDITDKFKHFTASGIHKCCSAKIRFKHKGYIWSYGELKDPCKLLYRSELNKRLWGKYRGKEWGKVNYKHLLKYKEEQGIISAKATT
jgi:hypothetical protein